MELGPSAAGSQGPVKTGLGSGFNFSISLNGTVVCAAATTERGMEAVLNQNHGTGLLLVAYTFKALSE